MKKKKSIIVGIIAVMAIATGIVLLPRIAKATETVENGENGIIYVQDTDKLNIQTYKASNTAPVRDGYVFAGWYSAANETSALSEEEAASVTSAWAKFVPDYVLSVRAQIDANTKKGDGATSIRVLSSVDSDDYQNVGFDIWLANRKQITMLVDDEEVAPLRTDKAFTNILVNNQSVSAKDTFGDAANYFVVWRLDNIADINDSKIIYVRPYWTTKDGTTVNGLAKYIHVEDGYLNYINIPINLMTGDAIAAGVVKMKYSDLELVGYEAGRLLKEMAVNSDNAGEIRFACNAENVTDEICADGIYANLRFKKPENATSETLNKLTFELIEAADFTNWDEDEVKITPVIQY